VKEEVKKEEGEGTAGGLQGELRGLRVDYRES